MKRMQTGLDALVFLGFLAGGCVGAPPDDTVEGIGAAIELDNGGLTMSDEAPAFGIEDEFDGLGLLTVDPRVADELTPKAATGIEPTGASGAAVYRLLVEWGQIPGNPANETARDWSGAFMLNRGAAVVERTVRFEAATDYLLPRVDAQSVPFRSRTLPHNDGLVLTLVDPEPTATVALTLTYASLAGTAATGDGTSARPAGTHVTVAVSDLIGSPVELTQDDAGNRMVAVARREGPSPCEHGFLSGTWRSLAAGRGIFRGLVTDGAGERMGHIRGVYGQRRSGERVFFGKYIDADGTFRGILAGHYGEGEFRGRWIVESGDRGSLSGYYRDAEDSETPRGYFLGRWEENLCTAAVTAPAPAP